MEIKMKNAILTIIVTFMCMTVKGQFSLDNEIVRDLKEMAFTQYECLYEYSVNRLDAEGDSVKDVMFTILQIGNTMAKFEDYATYKLDSVRNDHNATAEDRERYAMQFFMASNFFVPEICQHIDKGLVSYVEPFDKTYFLCEDTMPLMDWKIYDDTLSICGYVCTKATTEYGGRKWTAWYANDLPMPYGPWKLTGLPGLILQASDSTDTHHFTAFSFRKGHLPILTLKDEGFPKVKKNILQETRAAILKSTKEARLINGITQHPAAKMNMMPLE